jgi:hypothetical protein
VVSEVIQHSKMTLLQFVWLFDLRTSTVEVSHLHPAVSMPSTYGSLRNQTAFAAENLKWMS